MKAFRLIFVLLFFASFVVAEEEELIVNGDEMASLAALEGLPSSLVGGCVCAISGHFVDSSVDMVLVGPEPLVFERTYASVTSDGNFGTGWSSNHGNSLRFGKLRDRNKKQVWGSFLTEESGASLFYKRRHSKKDKKRCEVELLLDDPDGLTNGSKPKRSTLLEKRPKRSMTSRVA